ncbi:MAG: segregation/condensation protein A, partial [Burkholderiales bacterium]|nr:segregation/condensation protein A [Burkholderiales bacterium]
MQTADSSELPIVGAADTTPDVVDGLAFAKLYGEPLFKLP